MYTDLSWIMGMYVALGLLLPGSLLIGYATRLVTTPRLWR